MFLCPKVGKMALLEREIFFLEISHIEYKKNQEFCADFQSVNMA
jgi:hypothetical protein